MSVVASHTSEHALTDPQIRAVTYFERPRLPVARQILLPRPAGSKHRKPITALLFWSHPERELESATDLILDIPGGGFVSIGPRYHEERLRRWALVSGRPVLAIDYGKAPECQHVSIIWCDMLKRLTDPYPWALEECFDVYQVLVESKGAAIGMSGKLFNVIMTGDSAYVLFPPFVSSTHSSIAAPTLSAGSCLKS
jgi:acetyl esterase/lipase